MDTMRFAFKGRNAGSPPPKNSLLIIDLGAHSMRVGFLDEDEPRYTMRTAVSKSRNKNACFRMGNEMTEADFGRRAYRTPFVYSGKEQGQWKGSLLLHFDLIKNILEHMFTLALGDNVGKGSASSTKIACKRLGMDVFVAVPYCTPRLSLIILADVLINYFGALSVAFAPSELSLSAQKPFQIVLHLGYSCTTAYPLLYSATSRTFSIPNTRLIKVLPIGMHVVHIWLSKFLNVHYTLFVHVFTETFIEHLLAHVCIALPMEVYNDYCARMCELFSRCRQNKECLAYQETRYSDLMTSMDTYNCYLRIMEALTSEYPMAYVGQGGAVNMIHTGIPLIELFEGARQNEALQTRQAFIARARRMTLNKLLNEIRDRDVARLFHEQLAALNALRDTCSYIAVTPEDQQSRASTISSINSRISRSTARLMWLSRQRERSRSTERQDKKDTLNPEKGKPTVKRLRKRDQGSKTFRLEADSDQDSDQGSYSSIIEDEYEEFEEEIEEATMGDTNGSTELVVSTGPLALPPITDTKLDSEVLNEQGEPNDQDIPTDQTEITEPDLKKIVSSNVMKSNLEPSKEIFINVLDQEQAIAILKDLYTHLKTQLRADRYYYNTFCAKKNIDVYVDTAIEMIGFTSLEKITSAKVIRQLYTYLTSSTDAVDTVILKLADLGIDVHDFDSDATKVWPYLSHPAINYKKSVPGYLVEGQANDISRQSFLETKDPKLLRVCLFLFNEHLFPAQILFYPRLIGSNVSGIGGLVLLVARETVNYVADKPFSCLFAKDVNVLKQWNHHAVTDISSTAFDGEAKDSDTNGSLFGDEITVTFIGGGSRMHGMSQTLESYLNAQSRYRFKVVAEESAWQRVQTLARASKYHVVFTPDSLVESAKDMPKQIRQKASA